MIRFIFLALLLCPQTSFAFCIQPFLASSSLQNTPKSAGIILPISSSIFRYTECPRDSDSLCILRVNVMEDQSTIAVATLSYLPQPLRFDEEESEFVEKIATDANGLGVYSSAIQESEGQLVRIDYALHDNASYILFVTHKIEEGYTNVEALQSFVRRNIVVCE